MLLEVLICPIVVCVGAASLVNISFSPVRDVWQVWLPIARTQDIGSHLYTTDKTIVTLMLSIKGFNRLLVMNTQPNW